MKPYAIEWDSYVPEILTPGGVGMPYPEQGGAPAQSRFTPVNLLWDTGAVSSMISSRLVRCLNLKCIGYRSSCNTHGIYNVPLFKINLLLPNNLVVGDLTVASDELPDVDVLVGMDIINMMDLSITHRDGKTRFAFEMSLSRPSASCT